MSARRGCGKLFSPNKIRPKRFPDGYKKASVQEMQDDDMLLSQSHQGRDVEDTGENLLNCLQFPNNLRISVNLIPSVGLALGLFQKLLEVTCLKCVYWKRNWLEPPYIVEPLD